MVKTWLAAAAGAVAGAVVATGATLVLTGDEPARSTYVSPAELTSADCRDIIPDSVFETLGWQGQGATEDIGQCEWIGDDGHVSVGDRAFAASSDERAAAAKKEYDKHCRGLYDGSDELPDRDPDWLPDGTTACVRLLPENNKGNAALFFLTEQDEVVQIRLGALTAVPEEKLKAVFATLVETADRRW